MSKRKQKQQKWNAAEARAVLARIEREGTSMAQKARELGISAQKLYWWRHRLKEEALAKRQPGPTFIELRAGSEKQTQPTGFTVHVRGGRALEVVPGFDAEELGRLIAALEVLAC